MKDQIITSVALLVGCLIVSRSIDLVGDRLVAAINDPSSRWGAATVDTLRHPEKKK